MPITDVGKQALEYLKKKNGNAKGTHVFYASLKKGVSGSDAWHSDGKSKEKKCKSNKYTKALIS